MNTALRLLTVLCLAMAFPAWGGTVYRCDSADGGRAYASKRIPGAKCSAVGSFRAPSAQPAAASAVATPPAPASVPPVGGEAAPPKPAEVAMPQPPAPPSYRAPRLVRGEVYSYIKDGVRHYSSKKPRGVAGATAMRTISYSFIESCFACGKKPGVNFNTLRLNTNAYRNEITAAARHHGVDESIVRAIIHAESAFNPNALSRVGAQGLMQLMPGTARQVGVNNAFDPAQNIRGGVQYLAMLLKRFNGNLTLAAAGYNAGPGAVDKYRGVPPYSETRHYVERVGILADRYRNALAAQ